MEYAFVLQHAYGDNEAETCKLLGVFSSEERALESIVLYRALPGFRDHPDGFHIDRYTLDKRQWSEGFGFD